MNQYCRYCAFCFEAESGYRCSDHPKGKQPNWSGEQIKRKNHCKNFALSDLGDVITGKQYHPRNNTKEYNSQQLSFLEGNEK